MTLIARMASPFFEIALVFVRLDHVASVIVNADHGMMCVSNCIRDGIGIAIPQPTDWQRIGNQIDASLIAERR
jgi:hypothetical protein